MDTPITFRSLREIRKRESSSPRLERLDPQFYSLVREYLARKQASGVDDSLRYARVTINDIINKRERKILDMAISAVRAGISPENLLPEEEPLFEAAVKALKEFRERLGTAYSSWNTTLPTQKEEPVVATRATVKEARETREKKLEKDTGPEKETELEEEEETTERDRDTPEEVSRRRIIITEPVQEFMAEDGEIYGPYEEGEEAEIPERAAAILVESGKAEYA